MYIYIYAFTYLYNIRSHKYSSLCACVFLCVYVQSEGTQVLKETKYRRKRDLIFLQMFKVKEQKC